MRKGIKVGVIGLGAMGKNHARAYFELPEVEPAINVDYAQDEIDEEKIKTVS